MSIVKIENRDIGGKNPCFIIAEIGINHNGSDELAHKMIDVIAECGADCVKFQTFSAEEFMNSRDQKYEYFSQGKLVRESMLDMFKRCELPARSFSALFSHARARNLIPLSTPTDRDAVELLERIGIGAFKIGSDDLVYTPFIEYAAKKNKPIILSTGMANALDIDRAVTTVASAGNDEVIILHCVSIYPTPDQNVNLRRIETLQSRYSYPIGFSDHSGGVTAALGAVVLGACVVEKHFTLDRSLPGPDHQFSADPVELRTLVEEIRRLEAQLGEPELKPAPGEQEMAAIARRSIVISRDLKAGHQVTASDLSYRRPGTGLMPYDNWKVIGRRTRQAIPAGTQITIDLIE